MRLGQSEVNGEPLKIMQISFEWAVCLSITSRHEALG